MKFSLAAQIEEIDRELEKVYPSLVKSRGMRQSVADFHVARLTARQPGTIATLSRYWRTNFYVRK